MFLCAALALDPLGQCISNCTIPLNETWTGCFVLDDTNNATLTNAACQSSDMDLYECIRMNSNASLVAMGPCDAAPFWNSTLYPSTSSIGVPQVVMGNASWSFRDGFGWIHPMFNRSRVTQLWLEMSDQDWLRIVQDDRSATHLPCSYRLVLEEGVVASQGSCRVRRRGLTSRQEWLPALHVEWDTLVMGTKKLNLKTLERDPSTERELACLDMFYSVGAPAQRGSHYDVFLNGRHLSQFVGLEEVDKHFLEARWGGKAKDSLLLKCSCGWGLFIMLHCQAHYGQYGNDTMLELQELFAAIGKQDIATVERLLDVDTFVRVYAAETMSENTDWIENAYLLRQPSGQWVYFRHDNDLSFERRADANVFSWMGDGLSTMLWKVPRWRQRLVQIIRAIAGHDVTQAWLAAHDLMRPVVKNDAWFGLEYRLPKSSFEASLYKTIDLHGPYRPDSYMGVFPFLKERFATALNQTTLV